MARRFSRRYCTLTPEEQMRVREAIEEANRIGWLPWEEARKQY